MTSFCFSFVWWESGFERPTPRAASTLLGRVSCYRSIALMAGSIRVMLSCSERCPQGSWRCCEILPGFHTLTQNASRRPLKLSRKVAAVNVHSWSQARIDLGRLSIEGRSHSQVKFRWTFRSLEAEAVTAIVCCHWWIWDHQLWEVF